MSSEHLTAVVSMWQSQVSLWRISQLFRFKVIITWGLLVIESLLTMLFPLAIGYSVDSLLTGNSSGLVLLGALSLSVLIVGAGRRYYDTRAYATIFQALANTLVQHEKSLSTSTSQITARVNLLYEIIEFLENSLPLLMGNLISLVGVVLIIGLIDLEIMALCGITSLVVILVYAFTGQKIFDYNKQQNDELEQQVAVLSENRKRRVSLHFMRMMKWNIKLSDLETTCFSVVWIALGSLLIGTIILVVENGEITYGSKITAIMYVFQFIEIVMSLPIVYQQYIRLIEIGKRLSGHIIS